MSPEYNLIKSIHVVSALPIQVFDKNFSLQRLYVSNRFDFFPYDFKKILAGNKKYYSFFSGILDEAFISFSFGETSLIIGPFLTHPQSPEMIKKKIQKLTYDNYTSQQYQEYLELLPIFALGDIREFFILLNYLFRQEGECPYTADLYEEVEKNKLELTKEYVEKRSFCKTDPNHRQFLYENQILNLVQTGDIEKLREKLSDMSSSTIPNITGSALRTEKNYTIVILEKLSNQAIQLGYDIAMAYQMRDFYIRKTEQQSTLFNVLATRDSAIIHFTKIMHDFPQAIYSPLVKSVIQYIGLNLYHPPKVKDIAKTFFLSETALRRHFKTETGYSLVEYINLRKVNEAKLLLKSGLSPLDVAIILGYYDYSHFYKMFKKVTGISPKVYQEEEYN